MGRGFSEGVHCPRLKKLEILFGLLRVPMDTLSAFAAFLLAYRLRVGSIDLIPGRQLLEPPSTLPPLPDYVWTFVVPGIGLFLAVALVLRLYAFQVTASAWREVGRSMLAACVWLVLVMAWYFLVRRELFYSRILLVHSAFFLAGFVILARGSLTVLYRSLLSLGYGVRAVVSVGGRQLARHARRTLEADIRYHYLGHAAELKDLDALQRNSPLDLAIQTDPNPSSAETMQLIEYCRAEQIGYAFLPPVFADTPHQLAVEKLGMLPMVRFKPTPLDGWGRVWKRLSDVAGSLVLLALLSPLLLIIAAAVLLDTGWPVFYVSRRVGDQGRRPIRTLKFRSMVRDADARKAEIAALNHRKDGPLFKAKNDPRVTRTGAVLRRFSLDELPQLLNVLIGEMALVGPRPHLPEEVKLYTLEQRRVFAVRPGMTGLSQVSGRSDLKFEDEVRLDLQYIEEWSLLLDLWVLWRTAFVILGRRGAD